MGKKKGLGFYWDFMDVSIIVFVLYSVLATVFPVSETIGTTLASIIGFLTLVFVFGFVGFKISRSNEKDLHAGKAGAWTGVVVGLISAIMGIIVFYLFPEKIAAAIQQATRAGASASTVQTFMKIFLFADLVIYPAIYAAIGAFLTWLSAYIFRKLSKGNKKWVESEKPSKKK